MVVVSASVAGGGKGRDVKRAKVLAAKKQQMESRIQEQVESWFTKFDADGNNALNKEELRALLTHLHPEKPADDAALDNLMTMAGGATSVMPLGSTQITKDACMKTIQKYNSYLKDKIQLDSLFNQFDKDGSGTLESSELLNVLKAFAPNEVMPTDADVKFVLSNCDTDGDGSINRSELLPMLAEWKEIALDKELLSLQEQKKQRASGDFPKVTRTPRKLTLRQTLYATFEDPSFSPVAKIVSIVMMMVILVSTLAFIAESETLDSGSLSTVADDANAAFLVTEYVCVIIFTIDYVVRLSSCPKVKAFLLNIMNAIDLAAILPFWIFLLPLGMDGGSFAFVRVIRLIRVFRVFKLGRYSVGLQMFAGAMSSSLQPLGILVFVMSINMIIVSSIVHLFEVADTDEKPYPDYCFCTITNTFWWAVVTMTTVGYGDCYPITSGGKTVAVITMLSGVLILALPITVIGSNFAKMVEMFEEDNAAYTLTDGDGDGLVDEFELREFIVRKKKEGALQKNVDTKVTTLMAKYDPMGNGTLSKSEFTQLQHDIINPSASDPFADIHEMSEKVAANAEAFQEIYANIETRLGGVEQMLAGLGEQMGLPPTVGDGLNPNSPFYLRRKKDEGSTPGAGTATDGSEPGPSVPPSPPRPPPLDAGPAALPLPACTLGCTLGPRAALQSESSRRGRAVAPRAGLQPLGAGSGVWPPHCVAPLPPKLPAGSSSTNGG